MKSHALICTQSSPTVQYITRVRIVRESSFQHISRQCSHSRWRKQLQSCRCHLGPSRQHESQIVQGVLHMFCELPPVANSVRHQRETIVTSPGLCCMSALVRWKKQDIDPVNYIYGRAKVYHHLPCSESPLRLVSRGLPVRWC